MDVKEREFGVLDKGKYHEQYVRVELVWRLGRHKSRRHQGQRGLGNKGSVNGKYFLRVEPEKQTQDACILVLSCCWQTK